MSTSQAKPRTSQFDPLSLQCIQLSGQERPVYIGLFRICAGGTPLSNEADDDLDEQYVGLLSLRAYLAGKELISLENLDHIIDKFSQRRHEDVRLSFGQFLSCVRMVLFASIDKSLDELEDWVSNTVSPAVLDGVFANTSLRTVQNVSNHANRQSGPDHRSPPTRHNRRFRPQVFDCVELDAPRMTVRHRALVSSDDNEDADDDFDMDGPSILISSPSKASRGTKQSDTNVMDNTPKRRANKSAENSGTSAVPKHINNPPCQWCRQRKLICVTQGRGESRASKVCTACKRTQGLRPCSLTLVTYAREPVPSQPRESNSPTI